MKESGSALDNQEDFWDYVKEHKRLVGIAVNDKEGLDLLTALRDVWIRIDSDPDDAKKMLTLLASVLLSSSMGDNSYIEEVKITAAMENFDESIRKIINDEEL